MLVWTIIDDSQARLNEIRNSLAVEAGGVHTAMLLVRTLDDTDPMSSYKTRVLLLLASYIDHLAEEIDWQQRGGDSQVHRQAAQPLLCVTPRTRSHEGS